MCWASGDGVSPSAARQNRDWRGLVRSGAARHGVARRCKAWAAMAARRAFGLSLPPSLVDETRRGVLWHGSARLGGAEFGKGHRRWHGGLRPSLPPSQGWARFGWARLGVVGRGAVGLGDAGCGLAGHGLQTAARSFFGCSLLLSLESRSGAARFGEARHGTARLGVARPGLAWHGLTISARRAQVLPAGFTQHT